MPIRHHGGVTVLYYPALHFTVEAVQLFGPNVVGVQMVKGERQWYIIGFYLAPDDTSTIESVVAELKEKPRGAKLLVAGKFNTKLSDTEGDWRGEEIAAMIASEGLKDMSEHFLPRQRSRIRYRRIWIMIQAGREVSSRTDYILGTDIRLF